MCEVITAGRKIIKFGEDSQGVILRVPLYFGKLMCPKVISELNLKFNQTIGLTFHFNLFH